MSDARAEVLGRVRAALDDVPADESPAWTGAPNARAEGDAGLFAERVAEYRATVVRVPDGGDAAVAEAVRALCDAEGARRLLVPHEFPAGWVPEAIEQLRDTPEAPVSRDAVAAADGVVTACAAAIAETGTIILDSGPGQGRRELTLLPDLHVCVVEAQRIAGNLPAALARLTPGRPTTFISGPSATSDIELKRVEGVHGPRRLRVVVAG